MKYELGFSPVTNIKAQYPELSNGYQAPFKSIASFSTDKVLVDNTEGNFTYKDEMGVPPVQNGNELTVRGGPDGTEINLYAYRDTTDEIAGKLTLKCFDTQAKRVYIVPVNESKMPTATELQKVLNRVYGQAVTQWQVEAKGSIKVTFENGKMQHGGSGSLQTYNSDQKEVAKAYEKAYEKMEKNAMYLFFVDGVQFKDKSIAGFMPLKRQVGFIYDNPNLDIVAHELSHGTFNLWHTFSTENKIAQEGTTQNLMDYAGGTELWHYQWDLIHDPQNILFAWGMDESESEMMNQSMTAETIKEIIDLIRSDNMVLKESTDLSVWALSKGITADLNLTEELTLDYIEIELKSGKNIGTVENPFLYEALEIKPQMANYEDVSAPSGQSGSFIRIYFNRLESAPSPEAGSIISDSLAISFVIKKSQLEDFKKYLNVELLVDATWVSQLNKDIFGNCTCYKYACCFQCSQYIVKNSTGLYSPPGYQIATTRFAIKDIPLIEMLEPELILSGFLEGITYLDSKLVEGKPIVVGVYYRGRQEKQQEKANTAQEVLNTAQAELDELNSEIENAGETPELLQLRAEKEQALETAQKSYDEISQFKPFNTVQPTFHYVVVVGKGYDNEQQRGYYRFYEVGTSNSSYGTHDKNRLYLYDDKLMGTQGFSSREYIMSEVRQQMQSGSDCPKK